MHCLYLIGKVLRTLCKNRYGVVSAKSLSSFTSGSSNLLKELTKFSLLRRERLELALPINTTAVVVALLTSSKESSSDSERVVMHPYITFGPSPICCPEIWLSGVFRSLGMGPGEVSL